MKLLNQLLLALSLAGAPLAAAAADYKMESGDGHEVTVTENFYLYDDGGPNGNATVGFMGSVVLKPGVAGKAVKIDAVEFAVAGNHLMVYHGSEPIDDNLTKATGYFVSTGPKDVVSEAADGSLLIRFGYDVKYTKGVNGNVKGFKIEVSLADMPQSQDEPMQGTYRVGPSTEARFRNLAELEKAMAVGLGGPTVIELEDNVFEEALWIKDLPGVSETNTLTITSVSGKPDACVISGPTTPLDGRGILCIDATPYVTVKNITVATNEGNGSRYPYAGLHFCNGSHHGTVTGCVLTSPLSTTSGQDNRTYVLLANGSAKTEACDNLTVSGNNFNGGYTAIYVGTDPEDYEGPATKGLVIKDNTIANVAVNGVKLHTCDAFTVSGNSIAPGSVGRKTGNYIDMWKPSGAFAVTANRLLVEQTTECTVINLRSGAGAEDAANPALIANNVIAYPKAASAYTYGMMLDASVKNVLVAHNTVNIASTATAINSIYGIAFSGNAPAEGAMKVVNNIVRTAASGVPLRPWNDTHYANITLGHNVYYGGSGNVDSDKHDFEAYKAASGDETSVWLEPEFLSNSDLHLLTVDRSMFMPRLDAVPADYAGTERQDPTTAGAYEYEIPAPDAPVIAEGYPTVTDPTTKGVQLKTRWSIGGQLYVKAVATAAEAPTAADLKAGAPVEIEADREVVSDITGLQPLTEYRAYAMVVSSLDADSEIAVSEPFTTLEEIQPLNALIFWQDEPFAEGETVELEAYVEGGKEPYTYRWVDQAGKEVSTEATYTYTADVNRSFHLYVASSDGQSVICKDDIPVINTELVPATFDDLHLEAESAWMYDQELSTGGMYNDQFYSGSMSFPNFSMPTYYYWGGYGYSNETATEFSVTAHQSRNVVGGGAAGTAAYGFCYAYGSPTTISLSVPEAGVVLPGLYLTNSAYTMSSIVNGDGYSAKFEAGDYQEVVFEGQLGGESTGTVTVALADYRGSEPEILTEWKYVDLTPLGRIDALKFTLDGTKYTTLPAYLCLDEIGAENPNAGVADLTAGSDAAIVRATDDCLAVTGLAGAATLRVYSLDGVCRLEQRIAGSTAVSIASLPAGVYIATAEGAAPLRFAK